MWGQIFYQTMWFSNNGSFNTRWIFVHQSKLERKICLNFRLSQNFTEAHFINWYKIRKDSDGNSTPRHIHSMACSSWHLLHKKGKIILVSDCKEKDTQNRTTRWIVCNVDSWNEWKRTLEGKTGYTSLIFADLVIVSLCRIYCLWDLAHHQIRAPSESHTLHTLPLRASYHDWNLARTWHCPL